MSLRSMVRGSLSAAAVLCLQMGLLNSPARAQFNGPALTSAATVNLPLTPTTDPALLYPPGREIRLSPGDLLTVNIFGWPDYVPNVRVSLNGLIQLPLINAVQVKGLTVSEAESAIEKRLIDAGMYRKPQVTILVVESPNQVATVTGELHSVIPVMGQRRLQDVLAGAGGLPAMASHMITINRPGVDQPIVVDLGTDPLKSDKNNIPIFGGDTIVISHTGVVYMLGAFKNVGAIPLQSNSPLTLMQATSVAGGAGFQGKLKELRLVRTTGLDRKVVQINMKRILDGKDPDPVLQADDIVLLPSDMIRSAIKSGGLSTVLGFASILVVALRD